MLLYPDKSEVHFLPGSEDEIFSLQRYKEELGKTYQRISLYVCLKTDYNKSVFQDLLSDNESDFECKEELDTNLSATNQPTRNHLARNCSAINQSATSNSVENLSASSQPATSHLSRNQPATSQPATSHLSRNQPVTSQPATSHPSRNQPATCQSATAQYDTITSQSATDQPAISQPVLSQSEDDAIVPSPVQLSVKEMALHRSNVMKDMIDEFKEDGILNCTVNIMFLNDRGEAEEGRGSGVTREALSIFWREFFTSLAVGAAEKVPSIRHDYQKKEWQSVANVLVFGFLAEKFFPLQLSKAFIASCLFGEFCI
ncbi:uncharacterized protein LOC117112418 [Anneissia japonica]|uniref:uncharacterized protein LOC117112418 n=1 Tax=Anneissia japonica TaxID=1529436 RepID=UPI001425B596|nr:uncharacterized protein LOC117112418 [Anneissia japonica]